MALMNPPLRWNLVRGVGVLLEGVCVWCFCVEFLYPTALCAKPPFVCLWVGVRDIVVVVGRCVRCGCGLAEDDGDEKQANARKSKQTQANARKSRQRQANVSNGKQKQANVSKSKKK